MEHTHGSTTGGGRVGGAAGGTTSSKTPRATAAGAATEDVGHAYYVPPQPEPAPQDAWRDATHHIGELKAYAGYYVTAKLDAWKASLRNLGLYAVLGAVAGLAGAAVVVTAAVLVCLGLSGAIAAACVALFGPGWAWIGPLLVGLLLLGAVGATLYMVMNAVTRSGRERTVRKYESLQRQQQDAYGHDVRERAAEAPVGGGGGSNGKGTRGAGR